MANELREYLDKLGLKEEAIDKAVELATPENTRKDLGELGGKVKTLEAELAELRPLKEAPKRMEALKRVGIDYEAQPGYGKKALDSIPFDKLDDLDFVAQFVKDEGFEASLSPEQIAEGQTGAERITEATVGLGQGGPVQTTKSAKDQAFFDDLDRIPDGDKNAMAEVLAKHGRLPQSEG